MEGISSLVDQLKKTGIVPAVSIDISMDSRDVQAIKALNDSLKQAGIAPQVHITVTMSSGAGLASNTVATAGSAAFDTKGSITVKVNAPKLNCFEFTQMDKAGKPIMEIFEPRVQLAQGTQFSVSGTQKVGSKDAGDGIIFGTGNIEFYHVVNCPANKNAVGLYVRKSDVTVI